MMIHSSTGFFREYSYLSRPDIWRLRNKNFTVAFESELLVIALGHTTPIYKYMIN